MRMTFFALGIFLIFTGQAESQTIPIIWNASFEIEKSAGAAKKEHTFTFDSYTLPQTTPMRFLEMRPSAGTKKINAKVYVNGIKVSNSVVNPSLIPITLLEQNHILFSLEGRPGEGIQARVLVLDELAPLFGPLKIESNRKQKTHRIRMPTPGAGDTYSGFKQMVERQ